MKFLFFTAIASFISYGLSNAKEGSCNLDSFFTTYFSNTYSGYKNVFVKKNNYPFTCSSTFKQKNVKKVNDFQYNKIRGKTCYIMVAGIDSFYTNDTLNVNIHFSSTLKGKKEGILYSDEQFNFLIKKYENTLYLFEEGLKPTLVGVIDDK